MQTLRAILIVLLAISIPLPATAAAFGAGHCEMMAAPMSNQMSSGNGAMDHSAMDHGQTQASAAGQAASNDCCCDDCSSCDAVCAIGGVAAVSAPASSASGTDKRQRQPGLIVPQARAAHPPDLLRPPGPLQS